MAGRPYAGARMFTKGTPDLIKPQKASQQIIDKIRHAILEKDLEAGQKLPSEPELMRYFGVSRQTMREALCALETMGLLKIRAGLGGGAFVSEVDLKVARSSLSNFLYGKDFSLNHITEVRLALEPGAAMHAAAHMLPEDKLDLHDILDNCRSAIERGDDLSRLRRLEIAFHARIVQATENPIWMLLHDFAESVLWDVKTQLKTQSDFSVRVLHMHENILDAIDKGDAEAAAEFMRNDIVQVEESLARIAGEQSRLRLV